MIAAEHAALLEGSAIPLEVAEAAGVETVTDRSNLPTGITAAVPGLLFWHYPLEGDPVPQYRPDKPSGDAKYLFRPGPTALNVVPAMRERMSTARTLLIVEGTKQTLAAVAHAGPEILVAGIAGCWGWSRDGVASPELVELATGRDVVVALDADVRTNRNVHTAGSRLAECLEVTAGVDKVRFIGLPASNKVGLDDFLGSVPAESRPQTLANLIDRAGRIPKRPSAKPGPGDDPSAQFFDSDGLRALDVAEQVLSRHHLALAPDGSIRQYVGGVYVDSEPMVAALRELLANRYRPMHRKAVEELVVDLLRSRDLVLGDLAHPGLVNVANGMLDLATGTLADHDPKYLSTWQLPVKWNPNATCPFLDGWLADRVGDQVEGLLEAASLVLAPWITQRKTLFLYGPERSGKSTFARLVEHLVGELATTSVSLHALATNRFAAASLYGRALNVAGDLSDHHVDDLALYKQVTGDDLVAAERKFRDAYTFHNRALFVFTANQPPTVGETSGAYMARTWPVMFPNSVTGSEDRTIEDRLKAEAEGFLVQLVRAAQAWIARGGYQLANPLVVDHFAQQSDVAALFAAEVIAADPGGFTSGREVFEAYSEWAVSNGRGRLGRNRFLARLDNTLGPRQRPVGTNTGPTGWRDVRILSSEQWCEPSHVLASFASFSPTSPHEKTTEEEVGKTPIPHEAKVGSNRANRARPETGVDDLFGPPLDPDEQIEVEF